MIKEFVAAWNSNKDKLENYIKTHKQEDYDSYEKLLKALIKEVINPFFKDVLDRDIWDTSKITTVDNGDYQGSQIFLVPKDTYQPSVNEYFWTYQYYGSCSGCDSLMNISWSRCDDDLPTEEQVKEYMTLELHLLQRCRYMLSIEEEREDDEREY